MQAICDSVVILSQGKVRLQRPLNELNATTEPTIEVLIRQHPEAFVQQLSDNGLSHQWRANGRMTIKGSARNTTQDQAEPADPIESSLGNLTDLVWRSASASGATIESLQPAKNSLETIFMDTVQEAARADS